MIMISALFGTAAISSTEEAMTVLDLLMKGGIIMIPIVLLSLVSFYIFIERLAYINKTTAIAKGLVPAVTTELRNGNPKNALVHARNSQAAVGRILESGIEKVEEHRDNHES
jgi:biopolymer transport protein ExbB